MYEGNEPMIDKLVSPTGAPPATFSPLVRAVIDSVGEGIVVFDPQGRVLYANAPARRIIDGQNGDVRNRLQTLGARFSSLKNGTQTLGEAPTPYRIRAASSPKPLAGLASVARHCGDASSPTGWTAFA